MCFFCRKRSQWFYENVFYLKTKHTHRTISSVMEVILREDSASVCSNAAAVCFKCVDKINEYDDAFEKLQAKERELKSMIFVNLIVKHKDAADQITLPEDKLADAIEVDTDEINEEKKDDDIILDDSISPVNIADLHQTRNRTGDRVVERKQLLVRKIPSKKKNTDFQCDSCGTFYKNKHRLNVNYLNFICGARKLIPLYAFYRYTIRIVM